MRKEYNDRHNAPLVNPGFTLEEYESNRQNDTSEKQNSKNVFIPTIAGVPKAS